MSSKLIVRLRRKAVLPAGQAIRVQDIARLAGDENILSQVQNLICSPVLEEKESRVMDIVDLTYVLQQHIDTDIQVVGQPVMLVDAYQPPRPPSVFLLISVWLLLFVGSALAIMNFHADVSMREVHQHIHQWLTGHNVEHPLLLQIPYSFGLGIGMVMFFNRIGKRKGREPGPLELETMQYQEQIDAYRIERLRQDPGLEQEEGQS